ncbi:MAG: epoxyqueuosine reductase QueH [Clostridia bacterium]|nr:epoxyqueuosine reductase QueH [Clostridia bacterium]
MNRVNYDGKMTEILEQAAGKRLLLHSCCAPCSSYCLKELFGKIQVTVLYYNPNLDTEEEYEKRKAEQIRFLRETGYADFLDCDYSPSDYAAVASGYEQEKEGGARCERCFRLRLSRTAEEAKKGGYDYFATTLTLSPLKNAQLINEIGLQLQEQYGVRYLPSDFKKRGGYLQSIELSKEHNLYRQNYCGCVYSKR